MEMTVREAISILNVNILVACGRAGFSSATIKMTEDALDIIEDALKAKEPVKPRERIYHFFADRYCYDVSPRVVTCGACGECLPTGDATTKYCPTCGRAVKWE